MRRPVSAASRLTSLELVPHDGGRELPGFAPTPPPGGWTPRSALDAAVAYAESLGHRPDLGDRRRLASFAFRAIVAATPGLSRATVVERMSGVDVWRETFPDGRRMASPRPSEPSRNTP